jgi:hypothetical protein
MVDGAGRTALWRSGEDREARDAALSAELARYLIRSEPLGMDRHHQRYWHMQVGETVVMGLGFGRPCCVLHVNNGGDGI